MNEYLISVMGNPRLERVAGEARGVLILSRASTALISLLAMHTQRGFLGRETVADLIWPDVPEDKSRSRLSSALWRLRKALGGARLVEERGGRVGLVQDGRVAVDFWELDRQGAALRDRPVSAWSNKEVAALEAAMQARRGSFLDGVQGDWVLSAKQACAEAFEFGLECLMRFHRHRGQHDRSIAAARSLVRHDPYREDIYAELIELYMEKGQPAQAVRQFNICSAILKSELGVAPGSAVRQSIARATAGLEVVPPDLNRLIKEIDLSAEELRRRLLDLRLRLDEAVGH